VTTTRTKYVVAGSRPVSVPPTVVGPVSTPSAIGSLLVL
jgi:hypothetical protein